MTEPLDEVDEDDLRRLARVGLLRRAGARARQHGRQPAGARAGAGLEFREHRPYRQGDDVRRVDWRVSARTGHRWVRTFDDEQSARWTVCLDVSASMAAPDPARWRLAVQLTASFCYLLLDHGARTALVLFSDHIDRWCPPGSGRLQYQRMIRCLQQASPGPEGHGSSLTPVAAQISALGNVALISDCLAPDAMTGGLRALQSPGARLHVLHVTSEWDARARPDAALLEDVESGERRRVAAGAERMARDSLEDLHDRLRRHCRRHDVRYTGIPSSTRWIDGLLRHLRDPLHGHD